MNADTKDVIDVELTPEQERAVALRVAATQQAINRLGAKHNHLMGVAGRAPAGSNKRAHALALAKFLRFCCEVLATDQTLVAQLERDGMINAGWEKLGRRINELLRARQQKGI